MREALLRCEPRLDRQLLLRDVRERVAAVDHLEEGHRQVSTAARMMLSDSRGSWPQPTGQSVRTLRNAGPSAFAARSAFRLRSCQCTDAPCATYGMWCATAIAVMSLRSCTLPRLSRPAGLVVVFAPRGVAPER